MKAPQCRHTLELAFGTLPLLAARERAEHGAFDERLRPHERQRSRPADGPSDSSTEARGATLDDVVAGVAATAIAVDLAAGVAGTALEDAGVWAGREKEKLRRTIAAGSAGSSFLGGAAAGPAGSPFLGGAGVEGDAEGC